METANEPDARAATPSGRGHILPLAGVLFLDSVSYALILPILPFIVKAYSAGAVAGGLLIAVHALMATFSGPILGRLSDRFGRKTVIVASVAGAAASYFLFAFSQNLWSLFVARALAGAMAGNVGVVQAAAADDTSEADRPRVMGLLMGSLALGFVVGPGLSALIGQAVHDPARWAGLAAAAGAIASFLMVALVYPQTPPPRAGARSTGEASRAPINASVGELLGLIALAALAQTGLTAMTGFWVSHTFGWGAAQVSLIFLWVSVFMVVAQIFVVGRLANALGERPGLIVGLSLGASALMALVLVPTSVPVLLIASPVLFCGIAIVQTLSTSLLSKQVSAEHRGALLGLATGVASAARVVGPVVCGALFARVAPIAPYWLVGILMALGLAFVALRAAVVTSAPKMRT